MQSPDSPLELSPPRRIVAASNTLGEGPLWHPQTNRLYWGDIIRQEIHSCDADGDNHRIINIAGMPGSLHLTSRIDQLLVTTPAGLLLVNTETRQQQRLGVPVELPQGIRYNDGKTDACGRIWAGTMALSGDTPSGALYRIEKNCTENVWTAASVREPLTIPNGLAWNRDNTIFYHIDTPTRQLLAFAFDSDTGALGDARVALSFENMEGSPDGMAIDNEDKLWIAFWGGGQVCRFNPDSGEMLCRVKVPAPHVTSCCFGGADLSELFITSARQDLSKDQLAQYPESGNLFRITPGVNGRPEPRVHSQE